MGLSFVVEAGDSVRNSASESVGVSEGRPGDSVDQILARADAALYDAKLGGDRVVGVHAGLLTRPAIAPNGFARASSF